MYLTWNFQKSQPSTWTWETCTFILHTMWLILSFPLLLFLSSSRQRFSWVFRNTKCENKMKIKILTSNPYESSVGPHSKESQEVNIAKRGKRVIHFFWVIASFFKMYLMRNIIICFVKCLLLSYLLILHSRFIITLNMCAKFFFTIFTHCYHLLPLHLSNYSWSPFLFQILFILGTFQLLW